MPLPKSGDMEPLQGRFPRCSPALVELLHACLQPDPAKRPTAAQLLAMPYFSDASSWLSHEFQQAQVGCHCQCCRCCRCRRCCHLSVH